MIRRHIADITELLHDSSSHRGAALGPTAVIFSFVMNWIFGLLVYYLRYFVGWGSFGQHGAYPIDEFARETQRVWTEADRDAHTNSRVAPEVDFVSTAVPVEGAVNYSEMKWDTFTSIAETPEQFAFYNGKSIALVIRKSRFQDRLELLTLRRVIRRHVANNELLDD